MAKPKIRLSCRSKTSPLQPYYDAILSCLRGVAAIKIDDWFLFCEEADEDEQSDCIVKSVADSIKALQSSYRNAHFKGLANDLESIRDKSCLEQILRLKWYHLPLVQLRTSDAHRKSFIYGKQYEHISAFIHEFEDRTKGIRRYDLETFNIIDTLLQALIACFSDYCQQAPLPDFVKAISDFKFEPAKALSFCELYQTVYHPGLKSLLEKFARKHKIDVTTNTFADATKYEWPQKFHGAHFWIAANGAAVWDKTTDVIYGPFTDCCREALIFMCKKCLGESNKIKSGDIVDAVNKARATSFTNPSQIFRCKDPKKPRNRAIPEFYNALVKSCSGRPPFYWLAID